MTAPNAAEKGAGAEWRNRQPGMAYRRLGHTGLMVSEVVCGGDPITTENYCHLERTIAKGLNYLDMAPAYNEGDNERAYGKLVAGSPSGRGRVFLATKVSDYNRVRTRLYEEVLKGLPEAEQEAIRQRDREIREERRLETPGYYLTEFPASRGPSSRPTSAPRCGRGTASVTVGLPGCSAQFVARRSAGD
jgi:hypothetical protein